jgi:hypothetical protein
MRSFKAGPFCQIRPPTGSSRSLGYLDVFISFAFFLRNFLVDPFVFSSLYKNLPCTNELSSSRVCCETLFILKNRTVVNLGQADECDMAAAARKDLYQSTTRADENKLPNGQFSCSLSWQFRDVRSSQRSVLGLANIAYRKSMTGCRTTTNAAVSRLQSADR